MSKRILILTAGSQGDVQPYIALGKGLKQAGFEVLLATDPSFASLVTGHMLTLPSCTLPLPNWCKRIPERLLWQVGNPST